MGARRAAEPRTGPEASGPWTIWGGASSRASVCAPLPLAVGAPTYFFSLVIGPALTPVLGFSHGPIYLREHH